MATMNKVRLPDNTEVDIQDKRIEDLATVDSLAVDSTPTAGSMHLVTSGGVKTAISSLNGGNLVYTGEDGEIISNGDSINTCLKNIDDFISSIADVIGLSKSANAEE